MAPQMTGHTVVDVNCADKHSSRLRLYEVSMLISVRKSVIVCVVYFGPLPAVQRKARRSIATDLSNINGLHCDRTNVLFIGDIDSKE